MNYSNKEHGVQGLKILAVSLGVLIHAGCVSSFPQVERSYAVTYDEVFAELPEIASDVDMEVQCASPQEGSINLISRRMVDLLLTGAVQGLIAGDVVVVLVERESPQVTRLRIDSKTRATLEPSLGRPERNVSALVEELDKHWQPAEAKAAPASASK